MTTENNSTESTTQENKGEVTLDLPTALAELAKVKTDFEDVKSSRDKVKSDLRKLQEDFSSVSEFKTKYEALETESAKLKELLEAKDSEFNAFKESIKLEKVQSKLNTAIESAGAKKLDAVLKFIDQSKIEFDDNGQIKEESILTQIKDVKDNYPFLFNESFIDPGVKKPGSTSVELSYERELEKAKTPQEREAVWKKFYLK